MDELLKAIEELKRAYKASGAKSVKVELADGDTKCVEIVDKTDYKAKQFCMYDFETQTNGEWMRGLSDEELANYLVYKECMDYGSDDDDLYSCKLSWLRAEHKE